MANTTVRIETLLNQWMEHLTSDKALDLLFGMILIVGGWFFGKIASNMFIRAMGDKLTVHQQQIFKRIMFHMLFVLFAISGLREIGFKLNIFLGAAGLLTVAIGFASQTSASNLISGLFLIGEGPFSIGDIIQIDKIEGEVLSIDLLSVKLLTRDNVYIRIPNEQLIKVPVMNLTRYPIRRVSLKISIAYHENIGKVRQVLLHLADDHPFVLDEPKPLVTMQSFADSSIDLLFAVWTRKENYLTVRDEIQEIIKNEFDAHAIEIPFPQVQVHSNNADAAEVVPIKAKVTNVNANAEVLPPA